MTTDNITNRQVTEIIAMMIRDNPRASRETLANKFMDRLCDPDFADYARAAVRHFFSMHYKTALTLANPMSDAELQAYRDARRQRMEAEEEIEVDRVRATILANLLDFLTPLGKKLKDCTGSECSGLGGFFSRVGQQIKPREIVGQHLTNDDLRDLFRNYRSNGGTRRDSRDARV